MSVIAIFNQKGGVAKTTTASNLGSGLAQSGYKVLLVDSDPQSNCTNSVGFKDETINIGLFELIEKAKINKDDVQKVILKTKHENLDLLPADISLANAERHLMNAISRDTVLKDILKHVKDQYDFIIIDCPPSLGLLSINALTASNSIIIPVYPSYFSVKGISNLLDTYDLVKEKLNPSLEIMGVLLTKYDNRKNISKNIKESLTQVFGNKIFNTVIRTNAQIEYAQDNEIPVIYYDEKSNGYADYMSLTKEVLQYNGKQ